MKKSVGIEKQARSRRRMGPLLAVTLLVLLSAYLLVCGVAADRLSQAYRRPLGTTPAAYGLPYEEVAFMSAVDAVPLKGWLIGTPGAPTVLALHGRNSARDDGNIMTVAQELVRHGYSVFTFDFRTHGESGGSRYSLGMLETRDVAGALQYLEGRGVEKIGALGFSMGASVGLLSLRDHPEIRAYVSDSAYADLPALLDVEMPKATRLPSFFTPGILLAGKLFYGIDLSNTKPEREMARLGNRPLLLIHGEGDELIPVSHAYALQKAGAGNPNLAVWIVPGAGHVQAVNLAREEYLGRVVSFFDQHLR